ncbi:MAG: MerR family transcriptional regulator [Rikenellaceae bacterium]
MKKLYYTMGEVSEMFCVAPSLIRYWEKHFSVIKPQRNKKGNRLFTASDVENFKIIYHLVKERGMTLEGAQRTMRQNKKGYSRDAELLERLQHIRSLLLEVREELKEDDPSLLELQDDADDTIDCKDYEESMRCSIGLEEIADEEGEGEKNEEEKGQEPSQAPAGEPIDHSARATNRTPDAKPKELFAFYEQSLF